MITGNPSPETKDLWPMRHRFALTISAADLRHSRCRCCEKWGSRFRNKFCKTTPISSSFFNALHCTGQKRNCLEASCSSTDRFRIQSALRRTWSHEGSKAPGRLGHIGFVSQNKRHGPCDSPYYLGSFCQPSTIDCISGCHSCVL